MLTLFRCIASLQKGDDGEWDINDDAYKRGLRNVTTDHEGRVRLLPCSLVAVLRAPWSYPQTCAMSCRPGQGPQRGEGPEVGDLQDAVGQPARQDAEQNRARGCEFGGRGVGAARGVRGRR